MRGRNEMTIWERLTREPVLITGLVTAGFGVAVTLGVPVTEETIGAVMTLLGAIMAVLRVVVTPKAEVVATQKPGESVAQAGPKAELPNGTDVVVVPKRLPTVSRETAGGVDDVSADPPGYRTP